MQKCLARLAGKHWKIIIEKYLQNQHNMFHNFIDFKKVFDRVLYAGLRRLLRSFNTQALYENSNNAVLSNS